MTGYTVHTGTSDKYATGWDAIFGKAPAKKAVKAKKAAPKKAAKKKKAGR